MKEITKLSGKNQTTVPREVRRALHLQPGDRMVFDVAEHEDAIVVTLRRFPTLEELAGSVPVPEDVRGLSWSEIRERAWSAPAGERGGNREVEDA